MKPTDPNHGFYEQIKAHFSQFKDFQCVLTKETSFFLVATRESSRKVFIKCIAAPDGYQRAKSEFDAARAYGKKLAPSPSYGVPDVLACADFPGGYGVLVVEHVSLARGDRWFKWFASIPLMRDAGIKRAAQWLRHFHDVGDPSATPVREAVDVAMYEAQFVNFAREQAILDDRVTSGIEALCTLGSNQPVVVCNLHGDYTPANTFMTRHHVVGYDFADGLRGVPTQDIAQYLITLIWLSRPLLSPYDARALARDRTLFLSHYGTTLDRVESKLLDIFIMNEALVHITRMARTRKNPRKLRSALKRTSIMTSVFLSIVHSYST